MVRILSSEEAFDRYEKVRSRFPVVSGFDDAGISKAVSSLADIADRYDVFVFDAFGVLNVGDAPIAGAPDRIEELRSMGKQLFVLTNAASYKFPKVEEKFTKLGFSFLPEELISSRDVCEKHLSSWDATLKWGVIAPHDFCPLELSLDCIPLGNDLADYDGVDAVLFLSTECWDEDRQALLVSSLSRKARPVVVANPDLVAPREVGLTVEPGFYAHDLLDRVPDLDVHFHGKPFPSVYDRVEMLLGEDIDCRRIAMMGDSLHTDILGAKIRGWGSVLVTDHGFLKGQDPLEAIRSSGICPDWIVPSI